MTLKCMGEFFQKQLRTKSPGAELESRTRKSPSLSNRDSAAWRQVHRLTRSNEHGGSHFCSQLNTYQLSKVCGKCPNFGSPFWYVHFYDFLSLSECFITQSIKRHFVEHHYSEPYVNIQMNTVHRTTA